MGGRGCGCGCDCEVNGRGERSEPVPGMVAVEFHKIRREDETSKRDLFVDSLQFSII